MNFIPHSYQRFSVKFIKEHPEAMLFLDCGLGKTVISLTAILDLMFDSFVVSKSACDRSSPGLPFRMAGGDQKMGRVGFSQDVRDDRRREAA